MAALLHVPWPMWALLVVAVLAYLAVSRMGR